MQTPIETPECVEPPENRARPGGRKPFVLHTRVVAYNGGGPEKTILRSPRYGAAADLQMAAAYMRPVQDHGFQAIRDQARRWNCRLFEIPDRGPLDRRCLGAMLKLCKDHQVSIWHAHDYKSNLLELVLPKWWPMKLITTTHGWTWDSLRARLYHHVDNWCLKRYDQVITVSPNLFEHCLTHGVVHERVTYIPNGIDVNEVRRQRSMGAARSALGISRDRFVIGTVGRLSVEKGIDRAMSGLADLIGHHDQVQWHLVGDGPQRQTLSSAASVLGIDHAVRFHGWRNDVRPFLEMMDVLLLPSCTEALPNVVLEAMAMGVPVAATNVGAVYDLLDAGRCGVILSHDPALWAGQIAPLIASPERRRELACRARERVEEDFTFDRRMEKVFGVYRRALEGPSGPITRPSRRRAAPVDQT